MRSPELPGVAALATLFLLALLPTQLRARNITVLVTMSCLIASGISYIVNPLLWVGNVRDIAPVWCDISTNIWFISPYGIECAVLCICVRLDRITRDSRNSSREDGIRFEVLVCCLLPLLSIPLRYSLSANRYMILEDLGCLPAPHPSKLAMALIFSPGLLLSLLILSFAGKAVLNIIRLWYSLPVTNSTLKGARLHRLLAFLVVVGILVPTLISLHFSYSLALAILPWPGWAAVHTHFSQPLVFPPSVNSPLLAIASLASGEDVQNDYRRVWTIVGEKFNRPPHPSVLAPHSSHMLPEPTAQEGSIIIIGRD